LLPVPHVLNEFGSREKTALPKRKREQSRRRRKAKRLWPEYITLNFKGHNHWYCPIDVGSVDGLWQDESHAHLPLNQPSESAKLVDISVKPSNKEHSKK